MPVPDLVRYLWEVSIGDWILKALPFLLVLGHVGRLPLLDVVLGGGVWELVCHQSDDCAVMETLHQVFPFKGYHLAGERERERDIIRSC